jgi:ABC-type Fe3+/spermidine/putrescine transport system ATPase subunit
VSPASSPVLELHRVAVGYGREPVIRDVSFRVEQSEFITLLGPSGSGKTSLLRAIAGFLPTSDGEMRLQGEPMDGIPPYERDIAVVFQNYALFPHMTVEQNLSFGPRTLRLPRDEIADRVTQTLASVRLQGFGARYPHELSGGQQQRVAIARALAMRPLLLLLDEPMSNLDARLRAEMRVELAELLRSLRVTSVSVTHDQDEALAMSDRIIVMAEGGVRQIGTPADIYERPVDPFVAGFVGDANVIRARHAGAAPGRVRFETDWGQPLHADAGALAAGEEGVLLVRPEAISLSDAPTASQLPPEYNVLRGHIRSRAYMGGSSEVRVQVGPGELLLKLPAGHDRPDLSVGDEVIAHFAPAAVRVIRA